MTDAGGSDVAGGETAVAGLAGCGPVEIVYPWNGAVFPPEIAAPTFRWKVEGGAYDSWRIEIRFRDGRSLDASTQELRWTPAERQWETIKSRSRESDAVVTVTGLGPSGSSFDSAGVSFRTSNDEVGAPLFYREVNLPFIDAVKDPSRIRWRFGAISCRQPPPVVLEKLPVCGNCHSFSADGAVLGMDVDYANDKGSYAITAVAKDMVLDRGKLISWRDYAREDGIPTFGLLSQVSPDGRYVVSTVKDRSVFVATGNLAFSQLFFPIKGILAVYDRQSEQFSALPGADDPRFVQSNPVWSPDGKYLVFARSEAHELANLRDETRTLLSPEECREFLEGDETFRFDLYRIPFNEGRGGIAQPLEGASGNGESNYFPRFSPDGKWIVFCRAGSFMLLQPDSRLWIVPAAGGEARQLQCNTARMNSWHSWSPNGKWLVFSSKAFSPYTQLFLTHIDEQGNSSVPVVLDRFAAPDRAANIPEFVNVAPGAIGRIAADFLDDNNYLRAAVTFVRWGRDPAGAIPLFYKSLEINPDNIMSRLELATALADEGRTGEARQHIDHVLDVRPQDVVAHHRLGYVLAKEGRLEEAADQCRIALRLDPDSYEAHLNLGRILLATNQLDDSAEPLGEALRLAPKDPTANYYWAYLMQRRDRPHKAMEYYRRAVALDSEFVPALLGVASLFVADERGEWSDANEAIACAEKACEATEHKDIDSLRILAGVYAVVGRFDKAADVARTAIEVARAAGDRQAVERIQGMLKLYEKLQAGKRE